MKINTKNNRKNNRALLAVSGILIALILAFVLLEYFGVTHFTPLSPKQTQPAQTTSKQPSAQTSFTAPTNTSTSGSSSPSKTSEPVAKDVQEGTVTDNNGAVSTTPSASTWSKSADGTSIVVYTPTANQLLKNGDTITGTSTANKVNFRLVDDVNGVIAQGTLTVVNGKFSGTFNFSTTGTNGKVDVFTADANGVESNNVSIGVKFK